MKKTFYQFIFTVTLCISVNCLQAQISKGAHFLGGSFNLYSSDDEDYSGFTTRGATFRITPAYGRFINQNLVVGGALSYRNTNVTRSQTGDLKEKQKDNYYGVGVFLRQYKHLGKSGFYLFLHNQLDGELTRLKTVYVSSGDTYKTTGYNIRLNVNPGIAYAVTPRFHIETGLNDLLYMDYTNNKTSPGNGNKNRTFKAGASLGDNLQFSVGFRILLAK
ncbi:MAG: hypothetical protein ACTHLE_06460 [Agriterribacter sp.]